MSRKSTKRSGKWIIGELLTSTIPTSKKVEDSCILRETTACAPSEVRSNFGLMSSSPGQRTQLVRIITPPVNQRLIVPPPIACKQLKTRPPIERSSWQAACTEGSALVWKAQDSWRVATRRHIRSLWRTVRNLHYQKAGHPFKCMHWRPSVSSSEWLWVIYSVDPNRLRPPFPKLHRPCPTDLVQQVPNSRCLVPKS